MEENNELLNRWYDFLKDEIKTYCNSEGKYEVGYDYQDLEAIQEDAVVFDSAVENATREGISPEAAFGDLLADMWYESGLFPEDDFIDAIRRDFNDQRLAGDEAFYEFGEERFDIDLWDDLAACGYTGLDFQVDNILNDIKLEVNIQLATAEEQNKDMGSILTAFGASHTYGIDLDNLEVSDLDNALTYLIHQQGHSLKELYDVLLSEKPTESKLLKSIETEIANETSDYMTVLSIMVTLTGKNYLYLKQAMDSKEGNYEVGTDAIVGLYNPWNGGGSLLEIALEKPFIFSGSLIRDVQNDDTSSSGNYTIGEIYGGIDRGDTTITKASGAPSLYEEDLSEVLNYVKATYNNEEPEDEPVKEEQEEDKEEAKRKLDSYKFVLDDINKNREGWLKNRTEAELDDLIKTLQNKIADYNA